MCIRDRHDALGGATTHSAISGTAAEDQTLTAEPSAISDEDGLGAFSYQWSRDGIEVSGATSSTYTLTQADVGSAITVTVTYTDLQSTAESSTSVATAQVSNVNDLPVVLNSLADITATEDDADVEIALTAGEIYTFTNAGATGREGPTQDQVNASYASGTLEGGVTINTQGIQEWTVPSTGTYIISAYGARGGNSSGYAGGYGAKIEGTFTLNQGDQIQILVGQHAIDSNTGGAVGGLSLIHI